ncbi:porin [Paraflavitalea sp. CAU 1676]|uniref:porin n=1 Tax=Paraflavitalea sp. CAU 1676 TaxID=3032598 RepID=UPI0023DCAFB7|nr:porin [Paraflavitalea sp. CAU 1676]MDF2191534.1 porin [Paraflavitalea sp. CAU 1676]
MKRARQPSMPVWCWWLLAFLGTAHVLQAQDESDSLVLKRIRHGEKGFEFQTADNKFLLQFQGRLQFRFASPEDEDPVTFDDFTGEKKPVFKINRARLKIGGHAFRPWLKYYWEYELSQSNLLNYTVMVEKWDWLKLMVGQFKVEYTRERRISSGEQQMMDRSVINRPFTVDRQQGVELYGRLKGKKLADFNYWFAALTGTGRGNSSNDDNHLMYFGRLQWNVFGVYLDFEGSDLEIHEKPAAELAISAVTNRSPYTRFSQAGGGSLEGYENGQPGQYRVSQANIETAFMYKGISWQSELHWKEIIDKLDNNRADILYGYYIQAGYMFHQTVDWWPKPLELAFRNASYMPNKEADFTRKRETSGALNWFFNGHKNKLTAMCSYYEYDKTGDVPAHQWRYRLQWDISF